MHAASQLPGREFTDVDDALHLHVNQKSDYDIIMTVIRFCYCHKCRMLQ